MNDKPSMFSSWGEAALCFFVLTGLGTLFVFFVWMLAAGVREGIGTAIGVIARMR